MLKKKVREMIMRALIVLENHFFLDSNNNVWCDRIVNYNYLQRYLSVFDSIVVTGRTQIVNGTINGKLLVSGKNVIFVPMPDFRGAKGLLLNLFKLKKIIRDETKKCDCVIFRAPTHLSLFTYREVLKQNKILALEFMMAANKMFDGNGLIKRMLNRIIDQKAKKMCLRANGVSYVTDYVLQKNYPCKSIINPQNENYFTASYSSIDLSEKLYYKNNWDVKRKPQKFNIIHTGYMDSYRKGQDILIKAMKIVNDRGYDFHLSFIGDGEKKNEFELLVKEYGLEKKITFKGLIHSQKKVLDELKKSHFLVFPTQSEGLPRTIIEAMSQSLVCIASPVDGICELLEEEYLINYDDIEGYANKIIELMDDWNKCCLASKKNYEKSLNYSNKILNEKRRNYYNMIRAKSQNNSKY